MKLRSLVYLLCFVLLLATGCSSTEEPPTPTATRPLVLVTATSASSVSPIESDEVADSAETAPPAAGNGQRPDLSSAAAELGITEEELQAALGPPPPDFEAAAATLGIDVETLLAVLPPPPGGQAGPQATEAEEVISAECPDTTFIDVQPDPKNTLYEAPFLEVTCDGNRAMVRSNGIPNHQFVPVNPTDLVAQDHQFVFPLVPRLAPEPLRIVNSLGAVGVVINGVPIYGPNEGANLDFGDPYFDEELDFCNGHPARSGDYHYHAAPTCLFPEWETPDLIIGYAFDGFPILTPFVCEDESCSTQRELQSSWQRTSNVRGAWDAHEYIDGSGDLDECNGMLLPDGTYA